MAVTARVDVIRELASQPGIESIRLDGTLSAPGPAPAVSASPEWNLAAIGAPELWDLGYTGAGVVVANMDTGVDINHNDLLARWRVGTNGWFDPNNEHATPYDRDGHGTQTMGIIVGGDATGSSIGVAPGAQWIAVKIFDDAGQASYSDIHQGFQWILDPDGNLATDDAPDVVNNSWGYEQLVNQCFTEFQVDISALKAADIAVVFSGGNAGPLASTSLSPGNNIDSLAVGAVDDGSNVAGFSSRGPSACGGDIYPDVVAPGVNIKTSDLTFGIFPDSDIIVSGTSFAAPHVSGAMALLLSAMPDATVSELEAALQDSTLDLGSSGPDDDSGYGLIDVLEAFLLLEQGPSQCIDADGDGFNADAGCGGDCDDTDPTIYPGAQEIKHDAIDQDCNGFDLTIDIIRADYNTDTGSLTVEATSALGRSAQLELMGYGSMKWNRKRAKWAITVEPAGGDPLNVTVLGPEGLDSAWTTASAGGGKGGNGKGGGGKGKK
jgi:bacillopeptidase F